MLRNDTTVEVAITDQTPVINRSQLECYWAGAILPRSDWGRPSLSGRDAGEVWRITSLSRYDNPTNAVREHGTDGATRQSRWHEDPPTALLCLSRPVEKLKNVPEIQCASLEEIEHRANSFSCCGCVDAAGHCRRTRTHRGTPAALCVRTNFLASFVDNLPQAIQWFRHEPDLVVHCGPTFSPASDSVSCCSVPLRMGAVCFGLDAHESVGAIFSLRRAVTGGANLSSSYWPSPRGTGRVRGEGEDFSLFTAGFGTTPTDAVQENGTVWGTKAKPLSDGGAGGFCCL